MLTLRKLASLADGTRRRKTVVLIRDFERAMISGNEIDTVYLQGLLGQIAADDFWPEGVRNGASVSADNRIRSLNTLRHEMLEVLGRDWADWDAEMPGGDAAVEGGGLSFPIRVYLDGMRSPFNVGSVMRTSLAFGVERIWISPDGASPEHRRARRSSMGAVDRLRWSIQPLDELMDTGTVFALELGGMDISDFHFPNSGTVILGSEELGVSPKALQRAENDGGVVSITLPGAKASLNVGVAFGILIRQWVEALV